jgi:hypothetical protein
MSKDQWLKDEKEIIQQYIDEKLSTKEAVYLMKDRLGMSYVESMWQLECEDREQGLDSHLGCRDWPCCKDNGYAFCLTGEY